MSAEWSLVDDRADTDIVRKAHASLAVPLGIAASSHDIVEARAAAADIERILLGHVHREDSPGGLFDALEAADPQLHDDLDVLRGDHALLRKLIAKVFFLREKPGELSSIRMLAALVKSHEVRERGALAAAMRADQVRTDQVRTDQVRADQVRTDQLQAKLDDGEHAVLPE